MLAIEMEDLIAVLQLCVPYFAVIFQMASKSGLFQSKSRVML